jgi:hypothetical protein
MCNPLSLLGNGSIKKRHGSNEYSCSNRRVVGRAVFYAVHVVSKEAGDYFFPEHLVKQDKMPSAVISTESVFC